MNKQEYLEESQKKAAERMGELGFVGSEVYWDNGCGARWCLGRPGTNRDKTEIVAGVLGSLLVHGDYETCRFAHYADKPDAWNRLLWIADCLDVGYYVSQKARVGMCDDVSGSYDSRVAAHDIRVAIEAHQNEADDEAVKLLRESLEENHHEDQQELMAFLSQSEVELCVSAHGFGAVTSWRVLVAHAALQRTASLLRERHGPDGPPSARYEKRRVH